MDFAALLPIITAFLKGKSGDDLAGLASEHKDLIEGLLNQKLAGGQDSSALQLMTLILPLLMKQNSVIVVDKDNNMLTPKESASDISAKLAALDARIAAIETAINALKQP